MIKILIKKVFHHIFLKSDSKMKNYKIKLIYLSNSKMRTDRQNFENDI